MARALVQDRGRWGTGMPPRSPHHRGSPASRRDHSQTTWRTSPCALPPPPLPLMGAGARVSVGAHSHIQQARDPVAARPPRARHSTSHRTLHIPRTPRFPARPPSPSRIPQASKRSRRARATHPRSTPRETRPPRSRLIQRGSCPLNRRTITTAAHTEEEV